MLNLIINYIFNIMQLLKLAQHYNSSSKQGTAKQNPKNYYLNILESCIHIPKDDRLILRKYLSNQKQFDQNNEVIALLLKYSVKKNKQGNDQKVQVALRKHAEKIRKKEQFLLILPKKFDGPKIQVRKDVVINPKKYCNNFQLLKNSIQMPSTRRSKSDAKSNVKSIHKSTEKIKQKPSNMPKLKSSILPSYQSLAQSIKSIDPYASLKPPKSYRQTPTSTSKKSLRNLKQNNRLKPSTKQFKRDEQLKENEIQDMSNYHSTIEVQKAIFKHKHTRSKSLGNLIAEYNANEMKKQVEMEAVIPQIPQSELQHTHQFVYQSVAQSVTSVAALRQDETRPMFTPQQNKNLIQYSSNQSNSLNSTLNNFNTFNFTKSSFSSSTYQINTKSVHTQLKQLKICAQNFLDFLMPPNSKQSRSPSDLSMPYQQFIAKLNEFIYMNNSQFSNFCSYQNVYIPFYTLYDLVTFEKITQFIEQYAQPKFQHNSVRDLYTRIEIGVCGISHFISSHKRISVDEFKKSYQWKRPSVRTKFEQLVKRCSRWGTCITYWELYWLKDCPQFKQFQKQFNID